MNNIGTTLYSIFVLIGILQFSHLTHGADLKTSSKQHTCKDQLEIFDMIRNKQYNDLDQCLRSCQENYENNIKSIQAEIALFSAYEAFNNSYPSVEPALNEWVSKFPSSYVARAARGRFLAYKASRARGTRLAKDTSDEQFKAMTETFDFATKDFDEARRLYPKCLVAYCGLISINGVSGTIDEMQRTMAMGLSVLPDSLMVRQSYLSYMEPKWGGTAIELDKVMAEIAQSSRRYDKLHILLGYRDIISAGVLEDQRNFDQALPLFLKALEYGDIYFYYSRLGRIYSFLHLYDQSVAAYTKAIQIGPVGYRTLLGRSYSLDQVGRRAEALKDVNLGLTLFPDDKNLLERRDFYNNSGLIAIQQHSYSMIKSGSCTEALKEIDQGLTQFPDDKYLLELRGYCSKGTITGFTPWMSGSDYQKEFEDQVQLNRYPSKVEGKNESGYNQFRALFVPFLPGSFYFYSYYGMNRSSYEERMEDLTSKGFRLESSQTFIDSIGTLRYQATWIKK